MEILFIPKQRFLGLPLHGDFTIPQTGKRSLALLLNSYFTIFHAGKRFPVRLLERDWRSPDREKIPISSTFLRFFDPRTVKSAQTLLVDSDLRLAYREQNTTVEIFDFAEILRSIRHILSSPIAGIDFYP